MNDAGTQDTDPAKSLKIMDRRLVNGKSGFKSMKIQFVGQRKIISINEETVMKQVAFFISMVLFSLLFSANGGTDINEARMEKENIPKRVGSLIQVRPEYEERYIILNKYTFPGVLDRIRKSNIRNYTIFLLDGMLFSYYEYVGNDFTGDMKAIADSTTRDWWKLTDPMQEPLPTRKEGEWWAEMEQLFCLGEIFEPSPKAQRIGLVAEIMTGREEAIKTLCKNFPRDLEQATYTNHFQNCNLYTRDGKVYYYYEYFGKDLRKDMNELNQNKNFGDFQAKMNACLVSKGRGYWQIMKEVFHTD
jgi:L-rhamnose mutarotase